MSYIGALGVNTFDDEIEDVSNILVDRIVSDINNTSNYVLATSNILATRINDTSNVLIGRIVSDINDTSNYVKITSNILEARIKALEGTEGSPGDVNLGIPAIPSTGAIAVAAAIATVTAACISANGITVLTLLDILEDKVDLNRIEADKIGGWSSNYSDTVGVWGSNYVGTTSNILVGRINDTSNYVWNTSNILVGRIHDTSNYVWNTSNILVGRIDDTSNYVWNTSNILIGCINDTSNYVGTTSNILLGRINDTSNYVWNTSNILVGRINDTSNYVGTTSNILIGRINDTSNYVWNTSNTLVGHINDTSNYVWNTSNILIGRIHDTSNYVGTTSNILIGRIHDTSNYIGTTSNILIGRINDTSNYIGTTSNILIGRINDTSNYVWNTSNILIGRINDTSNYIASINTALTSTNYWTPSGTIGTNDIYLNQSGSVGIGTNTPQNKLHIYNTTSSTLRLETTTTGTASVIFQRGAPNDVRTDYRIINDGDILKFQYQDNLINFGASTGDIMWVYDKRTEFIKDGYFKGTIGIGMLPDVNALSITGDTYMDGSLGINTPAGSFPLDVYGNVNIDGEVGIGANPSAGVKLYVSGTTRLGGSVGIGVAPTSYALDINGSARVDGYVGIGTIPSSSTYRLDILGNFRTQGGIVSTGIIQAGNGLTASSGLITASAGISSTTLTTSGLITANAGITIPAGQTLTSTGTTILTSNVGIGTTPHATYKVDVNGTLNATTLLMGGNPISGSKWTTATDTTEIYYNAGNVGIGTTDPLHKLQVGTRQWLNVLGTYIFGAYGSAFINNVLSFGLSYKESLANFPCNKINFYPLSGYGQGIGLSSENVDYFTGGINGIGNHSFYTQATDTSFGTLRLRINGNGNVGIGISPSYKLHIKCGYDNVATGLHLDASDSAQYTLTIWPFVVGGGQVGWRFRTISLDGGTNTPLEFNHRGTIFINNNNVDNGSAKLLVAGSDGNACSALFYHPNRTQGIGIKYDGLRALSPGGNQDIWMTPIGTGLFQVSSSTYSATINGGYLGTGGAGSGTFFWGNICAKFNGSAWMTGSVIASSDIRIKEDIQDINDDEALNKLLAIEPKTYKYVDKIAKGDKKVYGFIAQQVREVIPEATTIEKSYIPNIMIIGEFNDYIITLPSQPLKVIIKVNDNIKCYDKDNNEILVKVEEVIDEITFKIKAIDDMKPLEYTHDKIFIHGTEVEDFHTLSKEYIFTLNVCATQELHRRIISQEERIKELELKVERLLNYIT